MMHLNKPWLALILLSGLALNAPEAQAIDVTGWTCAGNCNVATADGVVTNAPVVGSTGYAWVSTNGGTTGVALTGVGGTGSPTNGSTYTSVPFVVPAATSLEFHFNYVTSDGAGFADYSWARLLDNGGNEVALLFTARTHPTDSVVPGFSMPPLTATLTPASVPIIGGGPAWSALGGSSGGCFDAGCGYSGWVKAEYLIPAAGTYRLEIGVVNWDDTGFDSGLAVDGLLVGGVVPGTPVATRVQNVPSLNAYGLGLLALLMLGGFWLRHKP